MIKKPWFVRLFGLLFWCGVAWIALVLWAGTHIRGASILWLGYWVYIMATVFCLCVWLLGSMFAWMIKQQQTRAAFSSLDSLGLLARKPFAPATQPAVASLPLASWHAQIVCESCKRYAAAMHCVVDSTNLCLVCAPGHDTADCVYIPARRSVQSQAAAATPAPLQMSAPLPVDGARGDVRRARKKTVMTSPLGLASVE